MESYYRCDLVTIVTCSSTLLCINCFYNFEVSVSVRLALYFYLLSYSTPPGTGEVILLVIRLSLAIRLAS